MRNALPALLATLAILAAGWFGYERWFGGQGSADVVVLEVMGTVVLDRVGEARTGVEQGQGLRARDGLVVGEGGRAVVGVGAETRLTLEEQSSIRVLEVGKDAVRVELEEGRVSARVRPGSPAIGVLSGGRTLTATDADFTVAADMDAALAVQTERGRVEVAGVAGVSAVSAGQRLSDMPGGKPVLGEIPPELLLQVAWPQGGPVRDDAVKLTGRTEPYARVRGTGAGPPADARADAEGRFELTLPLSEGENALNLEVRDVVGNRKAEGHKVSRDSTAPAATSAEVLWGP